MNWSLLSYYFANNLGWLNDVYKVLPNILYAILAIVGGAGTVYSVVLGVNLAKSENDEKRRYALYRLRNTLIGVALLLIIVIECFSQKFGEKHSQKMYLIIDPHMKIVCLVRVIIIRA